MLLLAESRNILLSPLMQQTCLGPYQASPSHRLECKHTAVAQGTSVWSLLEPAVISKRTCRFREQTCERLKIEVYILYFLMFDLYTDPAYFHLSSYLLGYKYNCSCALYCTEFYSNLFLFVTTSSLIIAPAVFKQKKNKLLYY